MRIFRAIPLMAIVMLLSGLPTLQAGPVIIDAFQSDPVLRALLLQDQEETLAKQKAAEEKLNKLIDQYKAVIWAVQRAEAQLQAIPQPSLKTMPENQRSQQ